MALPVTTAALGLGVALGCGLLIGIERERHKGSGPTRHFAGVRSFAFAALIGAFSALPALGLQWAGAALIAALCVVSHWRDQSADPGVTTELALFLTFLLGVCALDNPALAAGAAVIVAAALKMRGPLHRFARVTLRTGELRDALVLAGAVLVVRPLLPDANAAWLLGLNPKTLWTLIVVILSIQGGAHIAMRMAGPRLGMAMSGFASGFVSSVATIATMGGRCRANPALLSACVAGAVFSNVATMVLLWVVLFTVAPDNLPVMAPAFAAGSIAALAGASVALMAARGKNSPRLRSGRAFHIGQAAMFALVFSVAGAAMAFANARLGQEGLVAGTALAGFFDMHAAAASALALLASGKTSADATILAVLLAMTSNTCSKAAAALSGGWQFALRVHACLALILGAAWLPFCWALFQGS